MSIILIDDGTMDTVLRCTHCHEELRYNFDVEDHSESCSETGDCNGACYDEFIDWAIEDAQGEHFCEG